MPKLRLRAVPPALCPDFEALDEGVARRFIGWRFDRTLKPNGGFRTTGEVVEKPFRREYLDELRAGTLAPADEETARLAGVPMPKAAPAVVTEGA
jgi:hypothetical protein